MTDIEFDNFLDLDYRPLSYHDEEIHHAFDQCSGAAFLESYASCFDDIEHIYTGLHKSVDQVVAQISVRRPPRLDQVREQNRRLIDKLTTLESAITGDATAVHVVLGSGSRVCPSASAPDVDRVRSGSKRRRVSQSNGTGPGTASASIPNTPNGARPGSNGLQNQSHGHGSPSFGGLQADSKLAKKLLQVGTQEARTQVATFAAQLKAPECQNALPNMYQFSNVSQITDESHFLRLVLDLGLAIESSIFGEQNSRIKKRIALAHFYHAYTLAQDNPKTFLSWCDDQRVQGGWMLPKGGNKAVVQQRFADLIFSRAENHGGMPSAGGSLDNGDDAKRRTAKIQMWRKSGKKWAQIIQRFGYGILLLLPSSLSDEELRVAHDKVVACGLDLIDSRKHLFADVLQQANDLLDAHFFPQDGNAHLTNAHSSGRFERADWDDLLNTPALGN
ncbi:hypothetical protein OEA41_009899 [Lepraria neglecta]|uniref:Uncharacterized protein n=1 Tax=Lepraria neglecta TaxID=209136 RepID=A0AAD9YVK0_9LECA|nr:hypothetical protein OEA41_009899 [Lepraria neglecta]